MKRAIISVFIVSFFFLAVSQGFSIVPSPPESQKIERFTGRVTSINLESSAMVVQSIKAGMTFNIKGVKLKGYKTVANIKEGDRVTVQYVMHEGKATARTLIKNKSYRY